MPRPKLIRTETFAYHVTVRSNNKEWFYISQFAAWQIFCGSLSAALARTGAIPYAFVLMSNHFHLLIETPNRNLDEVMQYFLSKATRWIQSRSERINHVLGNRYKWSVLDNAYAVATVLKYVYRNPVRAGICRSVEAYPFSTLTQLDALPLAERIDGYWNQIPRDFAERLAWLNKPCPREQEELIGRAAKRYKFGFSSHSNHQAALRALRQSYLPEPMPI